jgi:hypothetical protein
MIILLSAEIEAKGGDWQLKCLIQAKKGLRALLRELLRKRFAIVDKGQISVRP